MYERNTVLTLKNPRDPDPETGEEFAYNEVEVIGPSPINHGASNAEWEGPGGAGVIVSPLSNFGATLDEPNGTLVALYDGKSVPETVVEELKLRVINSTSQSAGPTPEEQLAAAAPGVPPEPGQKRGRTPMQSPLDDPRPRASDGPLGPVPPPLDPPAA